MSWRFRKSFKLLPGVRLNLSRRGISTTIGGAPFSLNVGPRGAYATTSLPGTGISMRQRIGGAPVAPTGPATMPAPAAGPGYHPHSDAPEPAPSLPAMSEIRSASTQEVTSAGLEEFRRLLLTAYQERESLSGEIRSAKSQAERSLERYRGWELGFLFRRIMPARFAQLRAQADEDRDRLSELEEQFELTRISTELDVPEEHAATFHQLCDSFSVLGEARRIWDTLASRSTNKRVERTTAEMSITREPVRFALGGSDLIACPWRVPHLQNRNGGDLFIYPGFVLYRISQQAFAVIEAREIKVDYLEIHFHEQEAVPADSEIVGETWLKTNRDGSPDRRFRDNQRIPVARYGMLTFTSERGLHEQYLISNARSAKTFADDWQAFSGSWWAESDSPVDRG